MHTKATAASVSSFDFSTVNTSIPHNKQVKVLFERTDFCFSAKGDHITV